MGSKNYIELIFHACLVGTYYVVLIELFEWLNSGADIGILHAIGGLLLLVVCFCNMLYLWRKEDN